MTTEIYDLEEIKRALEILLEPGDVTEVRGLKTLKKTQIGFYNDREKMVQDVMALSGRASGVYDVIDKVDTALLARSANRLIPFAAEGDGASDKDIIQRRWFKLDADPKRPHGISSTDSEHEAALSKVFHISGYLNENLCFPADSMLLADSGNGAHLLIRINLPNTPESTTLVQKCIKSVAYLFNDDKIQIDTSVYNPARIWKVYGTLACNGSDTPDRPHRIAKLLIVPDKVVIAPKELLERLAAIAPEDPKPAMQTHTGEKFDLTTWLSTHDIKVKRVSKWESWDKFELECCPFDSAHTGSSVCILQAPNGAIKFKCYHNSCQGKEWTDLRELKEPGYKDVKPNNNYINKYNVQGNNEALFQNSFKSGHSSGQSMDNARTKGDLSEPFDQFLCENPEPHFKREVAEIIGTTYKDPSFIKLVQRRKGDGQIRVLYGGDKIQWINREWKRSIVQLDSTTNTFTNLQLPFGAEKYIAVPHHSQLVVAGDVGSGKTHWGYLLADLNVGKIPIRHFFNEMGSSKAKRNLEDFPNLLKHYAHDYFLVDLDKEGIDVIENLDPNGLNLFDYYHLVSSNEWFLKLQQYLTTLSQRLEQGVICVMLQKRRGQSLGMGGDSTRMQCEVYFTLNIVSDQDTYKECRIDCVKAKDWVTNTNPETLCCKYKTAPRWGKLVKVGDWERKPLQ